MPETNLDLILRARDKASKEIESALIDLQKRVNNLESSQEKLNKTTLRSEKIFRNLARLFTGYVAARVLRDTANAAIEFESAFAGVRKTVDASEAEFKQLSDGILNLSRTIPVAATELARIQEIGGQLGIRGVSNLQKFTEVISKIGPTTNLSVDSAAIGLSRFAGITGDGIENVDRLASSIVDLGNNSRTFESDILELATRIAATGSSAGLTASEILGVSTAFAQAGINAEAGGTAIQEVFIELIKQGRTGSGEFVSFVEDIASAGDQGAATLERLGFNSSRLQRAFLSVARESGVLSDKINLANKAYQENNALNIEAEKRFGTTAAKIQQTKNNIEFLQIAIATKLLPAFESLLILTQKYVDFAIGADLNVQQTKVESLTKAYEEQKNELEELLILRSRAFGSEGDTGLEKAIVQAETRLNVIRRQILEEEERLRQKSRDKISSPEFDRERAIGDLPGGAGGVLDEVLREQEKAEQIKEINIGLNTFLAANRSALTQKIIEFNQKEFKTEQERAEARKQLEIEVAQTALATGLNLLATLARENKAAAVAFKAVQIGRAIINTSEAITEALPNLPLVALVSAIGAAEIANIAAQEFHTGGVVRSLNGPQGLASDEVPVIAQAGEGFLTRQGVRNVGGEAGVEAINDGRGVGGSRVINITINNPQMNNSRDIHALASRLGEEIDRELSFARGI